MKSLIFLIFFGFSVAPEATGYSVDPQVVPIDGLTASADKTTEVEQEEQKKIEDLAQQQIELIKKLYEAQTSTPVVEEAISPQPIATLPTPMQLSQVPSQESENTVTNSEVVSMPEPTTQLKNPTEDLNEVGMQCLQKCRGMFGISCKNWDDGSITCCQFTGCQWPFYCNPDKRIMVPGCNNRA